MATRAQVVELKQAGKSAQEIAGDLQISVTGVYNHLRRAGLASGGRRGRPTKAKASSSSPAAVADPVMNGSGANGVPTPVPGEHEVLAHIRATIADAVEHIESEMHLKREELSALDRQHQQLYNMLTTPLPDTDEQ